MRDTRFFQIAERLDLTRIEAVSGAAVRLPVDGLKISDVAPLSRAGRESIAFLSSRRHLGDLAKTKAGAVILPAALADAAPAGCAVLVSAHPHAAWASVARHLFAALEHDQAAGPVHPDAVLEEGVRLGPNVVIGPGAHIGAGACIRAGAVIGPGVMVGRGCVIGEGASIRHALIGDRVKIHAGARIGEAGFSVADGPAGPVDVPQLGRVILQDGVTVGANSCIDRGGWDDTVVGENTKIDNLVHIGHNVQVGRNGRMAAFTGISGSVTIGDDVLFGGKAGVADWVEIGDKAAIGASASVFKNVPAGQTWTGFPARPLRKWLREQATLSRLSKSGRGSGDDEQG